MAVKDWWEDFYADDCLKIGSWEDQASHIQRTATIVVAASDSDKKRGADYICDGTADQVQINQAIAALPETVAVWDNCDSSAAAWDRVQSDETLSDDVGDFAEGTGSLKCVGGTDNDPGVKKTGLGGLDWSGYNLIRFHFKQDTCGIEYTCWVFFYDSSANWERYDFNGRTSWHQHSISVGSHPDATSAAALDWTDIVEIRIQADTDDDAYTFRVDDIRLVDRLGGKVVLMEGNYTIDDKIVGDANTVLAGFGDNSNIFVANGTDVGGGWDGGHIIFEDCDNVAVNDLQINLNGPNLGGIADKAGIRFYRVYRSTMQNIKAHNLRLGGNVLDVVCSSAVEISHCYVENFNDYGIAIAKSDNCSAHDNVIKGTCGDEMWGIAVTGGFSGAHYATDCSITNNRVEGTYQALHLRKSYRCSVIGNNCRNFKTKGIAISSSKYATISNNNIDGNEIGWVGIQVYKRVEGEVDYLCEDVNITGNVIQQCEKVEANKARGILITDGKYSSAVGNTVRGIDYDDDGVGIESTSDYVVISSNLVHLTHDGITISGNSCVTGNNLYAISGDGITCSGASGRSSFVGNYLRSITGTAILAAAGDDYCCVGNFLRAETINLNGVSNTVANNET